MKTIHKKFRMGTLLSNWIIACILILTPFGMLMSQRSAMSKGDYLMPHRSKSMLSFNTGIPYVAIGDYSYGISNRISLGVLYGYTPIVLGYGLRIKAIIAQPGENLSILLKVPMIYYPHSKDLGGDPWVLAWPTLTIEKKLPNGTRLWTGMGMIGASFVDALLGEKHGRTREQSKGGEKVMPDNES